MAQPGQGISPAAAPSRSAELADFLSGLDGRIAPARIAAAGNCVIDTLGAIAYGAEQPWSRAAARHAVATGRGGACTIVGWPDTASPAMAAFANGAAAHAFELDDVHEEAVNHPGAVVVPAALAVAATLPDPTFDATYAWKQGARVEINLNDGRVLERTVHGPRGSMHDPLGDEEIERKFRTLAEGRLDPAIPEIARSLPDRPIRDLTTLLRRGWRADASRAG